MKNRTEHEFNDKYFKESNTDSDPTDTDFHLELMNASKHL